MNKQTERQVQPAYNGRKHHSGNQTFYFFQLIEGFCKWYEETLDTRDILFSARISPGLPEFIRGDYLLVGDLLFDLARYSLNNHILGCVVLDIDGEPINKNTYRIYINITTSGLGIPPLTARNIFQHSNSCEFSDIPNTNNSNLYNAKIIAQKLNGDVRVQNCYGFGARYTAEFCLVPC